MKLVCYVFLFFLGTPYVFSQAIPFKIVDASTNEALAYRKVTLIPSGKFVLTDSEGKADIGKDWSPADKILISGFAINDTLIAIEDIRKSQVVKVKVNEILMEVVEIGNSRLKPELVGDTSQFVKEEFRARKLTSVTDEGTVDLADMKYGAFVQVPKGKERYLSKLFFHVGSSFEDESILIDLRILGSFDLRRIQPLKIYRSNDFKDLAPHAISFTVNQVGWNEVTIEQPIAIPDNLNTVLVLLDQFEESDSFTISKQEFSKSRIKSAFFSPPNIMWVADLPDKSFAAFMVEFLID